MVFTGLALACLITIFIRLAHSPYNIGEHFPAVKTMLSYEEAHVTLDEINVHFNGSLKFEAQGATILNSDTSETVHIEKLTFVLSNRKLFTGDIAPKHVEIKGVNLEIGFDKDNVSIAGFSLPTDGKPKGSLIEYLNRKETSPQYEALKTISLKDVNITFNDLMRGKVWYLTDAQTHMSKHFRHGEEVVITADVRQEQDTTAVPAHIFAKHHANADKLGLQIVFENSDTSMLDDYIPLRGIVDMKGDVKFQVELDEGNQLQNPRFGFKVGKGSVHIQKAYSFPFSFNSAEFEGRFKQNGEEKLFIDKLLIEDATGAKFDIKGTATNISTDPEIDLVLKMSESTTSQIATYLPDLLMHNTVSWIKNHIHSANTSNLVLKYKGKPKELPDCKKSCGFDGEFDFTDLTLSFLEKTPPITNIDGHFTMRDDFINITGLEGSIGNQHVSDVSVTIAGHFTPEAEDRISIAGRAIGQIQEVIETLEAELAPNAEGGKIKGKHITDVWLDLPLKDLTYDKIKMNIVSDLSEVYTDSKAYTGGAPLNLPLASLSITERNLDLAGKGSIDGIMGEIAWHENMNNIFKETALHIRGEAPEEMTQKFAQKVGINVTGKANLDIKLNLKKEGLWRYRYNGNFTEAEVSLPSLNWKKEAGKSLTISSTGLYSEDKSLVTSITSRAQGEGIELDGEWKYDEKMTPPVQYAFKKFKLGRTDIVSSLKRKTLYVSGESLDLSNLSVGEQRGVLEEFPKGELKLNINTAHFPGGELQAFNLDLKRENSKWVEGQLKAVIEGNHTLEGTLYEAENNRRVVDFYAKEAGVTLQKLGIFRDLRRGEMIGHLNYGEVENGTLNGNGHVSILDTSLVKAPILAKILSFISLEQLLTDKKGILFDEVSAPFILIDNELIFKEVTMKGPSIGLNFRGKFNYVHNTMDVKGRLIPVAGLNKVVGKIPLVGTILTGSQKGLIVADFSVKGQSKDPKVFVNPLSVVTPGIVKDLFNVLTGADDFMKPAGKDDELFKEQAD